MSRAIRHLLTVSSLAVVFAVSLLVPLRTQPEASSAAVDPASMKIESRPGAYFPPGFPLHGKVRLLTSPIVEMGKRERIRIEYTVGDMPLEAGMALEVWKHFTSDVEEFQAADASAPGYFRAELSDPSIQTEHLTYTNWTQRDTPSVFPYRRAASVRIKSGKLLEGGRVLLDLGGEQGVRMQHYAENLFNFRLVITRGDKVAGYGGDAIMQVTGGPLRKLRAQAPSIVKAGEAFPVEVLAQDEWGSLAKDHQGLELQIEGGGAAGGTFRYEPGLMLYVARDVRLSSPGARRLTIRTRDGRFRTVSNPIWVRKDPREFVYFGDVHQHTYLHDGRGVAEELYLYARRVGLLDFGAVSPHHMPMSVTGPMFYLEGKKFPSENWPALVKATKLFNGWRGFVSILGYEYSVGTDKGGHHNIYYNADEAPTTMQLDSLDPMAPIAKMLKTLQLVQKPVLVIPHIGGGPPDWTHPTDPRMERLFEIASVHGVFEESWQKHLEAGLQLAASAAGDTHTVAMGNAYPGLIYTMTNALTGVYAKGKNRDAIWNGMYDRRTFGVTLNERILVDFQVNGEPMGGEVEAAPSGPVKVSAGVSCTTPVLRVDLIKNNAVLQSMFPSRRRQSNLVRVIWGDNIYQRRAAVGMTRGRLSASAGLLALREAVNLDQAFESVRQDGERAIAWHTAAVSNDRDGFLADISRAEGADLEFRLEDPEQAGTIEVKIPLAALRKEGFFHWSKAVGDRVKHPYMQKMGVSPAVFVECDLVDTAGPLDVNFAYQDRAAPKNGDYYYLRVEQLNTAKAWSSPVWIKVP